MKKIILIFIIFGVFRTCNAQKSDFVVQITGFKSNSGKCIVYLYKDKNGFPIDSKKALASVIVIINNGKATATFKSIAFGQYAVSVVHDENDNGKLDTNFLGIPKEGIGTSNNSMSTFGPPNYEDSSFKITTNNFFTNIIIKYL